MPRDGLDDGLEEPGAGAAALEEAEEEARRVADVRELLDAERKTKMEHNNLTRKKERKIER